MKIGLISKERTLFRLCQEVASRLPIDNCAVEMTEAECLCEADVHIWDLESSHTIPILPERSHISDIFLVRRNERRAFLERYPEAGPNTLLKPVSTAALEVLLAHHAARLSVPDGEPANKAFPGDREALLECLLHASFRLQEFEDDRTNFWSRAAHDLRPPLTAASGYCGLLLAEQFGPLNPNQHELLERVQHSLRKLSRMASAMFQLTVGKQIEPKYELKRTDIEECISRSIDEIRFFASEKNLAVECDISPPGQPIYAEPSQIEQVLVNLLENACKFTPRNGSIKVRGYSVPWPGQTVPTQSGATSLGASPKTRTGYRIDIIDSGPGITPEHLPTIFEEYVSYDKNRSGGGLGLAICKMILRAHHGEIWAEPTDTGTTLSFVLPMNQLVIQPSFEAAASQAATNSL